MIRSLFIGFLILSALTTKGAGIQIVNGLNIVPETLPDIINAAVSACAERAAGLSASADRTVFSSSADCSALSVSTGCFAQDSQFFCQYKNRFTSLKKGLLPFDNEFNDPAVQTGSEVVCNNLPQCGASRQNASAGLCSGELRRTSGLSPPCKAQ